MCLWEGGELHVLLLSHLVRALTQTLIPTILTIIQHMCPHFSPLLSMADPSFSPEPTVQASATLVRLGENFSVICTVLSEPEVAVDLSWEYPGQKLGPPPDVSEQAHGDVDRYARKASLTASLQASPYSDSQPLSQPLRQAQAPYQAWAKPGPVGPQYLWRSAELLGWRNRVTSEPLELEMAEAQIWGNEEGSLG
ncbi:uncharacterized protein AAG666_010742 isoform 2-T3 [Megaptera novaeangliae]